MKVAILADFPVRSLPGFEHAEVTQKPATWLPPLSVGLAGQPGLEVHWLFTSRRRFFDRPVTWNGQTFHCVHVPQRGRLFRAYRPDSRALLANIDEIEPEFLHVWGTETPYGLAAVRSGRPFILSMQGLMNHYIHTAPMHPLSRMIAVYERQVFRHTRCATVDTSWGVEVLKKAMPHADIREAICAVQPCFLNCQWNCDPNAPAALFVGTVDGRKGVQDAVAAFADPRLRSAELWIVGTPRSRFAHEVRRRATRNVQWLGDKTSEEVAMLLSRAWCLVLPTRADNCPTIVKEARAVGLPVVTSPCGGQRDLIRDGINGFIVEPGKISLLTERLAQLLGDRAATIEMGGRLHDVHRQILRPQRMGERFFELYSTFTRSLASEQSGAWTGGG